ncbi:hypothetical protein DERP_009191 [Dermatophagoides pteronyssinus]|uniref:Uncharacterized protein n=1 Tax=Dermatophagoides pteronyssinus TaxID=6956 RepID=A0ABQ8JR05_DERPT|nr:hypothetical protein DERP_009191 [Dermatophagoides pteronyssinus]
MSKSSETESEIISLPKYIFNLFVSTINDLRNIKRQYGIWGGYFKESNENSKWYLKRFPYKPIYGLPDSLDCDQSIRQRFNECEILSHEEWDVSINEYLFITRRFCCFVWDSMHCEYNIAAKCDEDFSKKLKNITLESFEKACDIISATDGIYVLTFIIMFIVISYRINDACNYAKKYDTTPINAFLMKLLKSTFKSIKKSIDFVFYVDKFFEINKQKRTNPKWYLERFPYKPIYGLPDSLDCDQSIRQRFNECEIWSHKEWDIDKTDYFYTTKRFCCFVWDSMNCEYNIANKCDEEYSKKLKNITLESFKKCWKKIFIPGIPNDNYFCLISPSNQKTFRIIAEGLADYRHSSEPILIKYKKINEVPERPIIPKFQKKND